MSLFIKQYGIIVVSVMVALLILSVCYTRFTDGWREVTIMDSPKTDFPLEKANAIPILSGEDEKFQTGSDIPDVRLLVEAATSAGEKIENEKIEVEELEGNLLRSDFSLNGQKAGMSKLLFSVKGENGLTAKKEIYVLFDEGGEKYEASD